MVHFSGTFKAGFDNSTDDACKTYPSYQVLENVFSRKYLGITATDTGDLDWDQHV